MNLVNNIGTISSIIIACWLLLFIVSHLMVYRFKEKYHQIAKKDISGAFEPYADPTIIFYFFREKNIPLLKNDKEIWRLRQLKKY